MFPDILGEPFANKHTKLQMEGKVAKQLIAQGRESLPYEYSALLGGNGSRITCHYPALQAERRRDSFHWNGPELIRALRHMQKGGNRWLGVLHTHPSGSAVPSSVDVHNWHYAQLSYWILSFSGDHPMLQAYQWVNGSFRLRPFELS
ncbi:M67 family metallopeptidase [Brevibacillus humidisoli]|uniref:Mov34/MPN/PAD-1 family protein n=1 Tax=Brevibacillus humidisoli TaxID=2895522 RepID=UPI001E3A71DC|nr:M67 family metallopeptidase [Brevibacillus humidisoli]UFJ39714.1 M67 family metallopeptidase [Brevibacillus humidisoli]